MELQSLDNFMAIYEYLDQYKEILMKKYPDLTENEINNILHSIFYSNHALTTTELTTVLESLDESELNEKDNVATLAIKAAKIKSAQKKANKEKLNRVTVDQKADQKKDAIDAQKEKLKSKNMPADKLAAHREKLNDKKKIIDDSAKKQKEIITDKEKELETKADDKTGGNKFLDAYKMMLRRKGKMKELDAKLKDADEREAVDLKKRQKELNKEFQEDKAEADKAAKEASDKKKKEEADKKAAEDKKKKEDANTPDAKKEKIQGQIDDLTKKIEDAKKEVEAKGGKPKEEAQYKLDQLKKKLEGAKEALKNVGESFDFEGTFALIESELTDLMEQLNG